MPLRNASVIMGSSLTIALATWKAPGRYTGLSSWAKASSCSSLSENDPLGGS